MFWVNFWTRSRADRVWNIHFQSSSASVIKCSSCEVLQGQTLDSEPFLVVTGILDVCVGRTFVRLDVISRPIVIV